MLLPENLASLTSEELKRLYEHCEEDLEEMETEQRELQKMLGGKMSCVVESQMSVSADCISRKRQELAMVQRLAILKLDAALAAARADTVTNPSNLDGNFF